MLTRRESKNQASRAILFDIIPRPIRRISRRLPLLLHLPRPAFACRACTGQVEGAAAVLVVDTVQSLHQALKNPFNKIINSNFCITFYSLYMMLLYNKEMQKLILVYCAHQI